MVTGKNVIVSNRTQEERELSDALQAIREYKIAKKNGTLKTLNSLADLIKKPKKKKQNIL